MSSNVREIDKGWQKIQKNFKSARDHSYVAVGIIEKSAGRKYPKTKKTLLDVALTHEFGEPRENIPERSFLRRAFDSNQPKLNALKAQLLIDILKLKRDFTESLKILGAVHVGHVQQVFGSSELEPNSPVTIMKKKSSAPLIDTGRLRQSIQYEVIE